MAAPAANRKYFIGGNWKCNGSVKSIKDLCDGMNKIDTNKVDVLVAPISIHLQLVKDNLKNMMVSSQNVSASGTGAFTGEVSAEQLTDFGIEWTIIGHSERRALFGENDAVVGNKVDIALKNGLNVIACFGETLDERKNGKVEEVVFRMLKGIADKVTDWNRMVLAYEPVWAIGTGETCPPDKAQAVCASVRKWMTDNVGAETANKVRVLYGGSVKPKNSDELIAQTDIDGFLVGGASLKPNLFGPIIVSAQKVTA